MTLVDSSVWVDHFRRGNAGLDARLRDGDVLSHPYVIGELACGSLTPRAEVLSLLGALPSAALVEYPEVLHFVDDRRLHGRGLGWIDVNLLASSVLSRAPIWTLDKALLRVAKELGVAA